MPFYCSDETRFKEMSPQENWMSKQFSLIKVDSLEHYSIDSERRDSWLCKDAVKV